MSSPSTVVLITGTHLPSLPPGPTPAFSLPLTYLVPSANSGIGYAASKVINPASAKHHIIKASRSIEKGNAASSAVSGSGIKGTTSSIQPDVTDASSVAAAVQRVESEQGRMDVPVNNAGIHSQAATPKGPTRKHLRHQRHRRGSPSRKRLRPLVAGLGEPVPASHQRRARLYV